MRASPLILAVVVAAGGCGKKAPPSGGEAGGGGAAGGSETEVPLPARDPAADAAAAAQRNTRLAAFRATEAKVAQAVRARLSKYATPSQERVGTVRFGDKSAHATAAFVSPADPARVVVRVTEGQTTRYVVHDLVAGAEVARFDAPGSNRPEAAYSPDGAAFAAGGWDNRVTVWDTKTGQVRKQFPTAKPVWSLAYAPDGSGLVASVGGSLVLLDANTGETRRTFGDAGLNASRPAVSPDGKVLAAVTTGKNNRVGLWDVATGARHPSPAGSDVPIQRLAFTPDGAALVLLRLNKVVVRDLSTGAEKELAAGDDPAVSPDGKLVAYRRSSGLVVRDLASGAERDLGPSTDGTGAPFFFPGGSLMGGLGNDTLTLWDVEACRPK